MAPEASSRKKDADARLGTLANRQRDMFAAPNTPFAPEKDAFLSGIEPGAIGSSLVLVAVIGLIGFGGWSVLQEVQRVQIVPVDQTPTVVSDIDPLQPVGGDGLQSAGVYAPPSEGLDRLYRPQALDVPVLVARDAPIATLDPAEIGVFAGMERDAAPALSEMDALIASVVEQTAPRVVADPAPEVVLLAVRPAWVRVQAADGSIIFEKILDAGEEYTLPATEEPPLLRAGNSGSLFFRVNGEVYGPAGSGTSTAKNVALSVDALQQSYATADLTADPDLARFVAVAEASE
jgi:hypothetical protein